MSVARVAQAEGRKLQSDNAGGMQRTSRKPYDLVDGKLKLHPASGPNRFLGYFNMEYRCPI